MADARQPQVEHLGSLGARCPVETLGPRRDEDRRDSDGAVVPRRPAGQEARHAARVVRRLAVVGHDVVGSPMDLEYGPRTSGPAWIEAAIAARDRGDGRKPRTQ